MNLTIVDIAKLAGVSKSTVSRVLNGTGYVNEDTRKKVEAVIAEHKFRPSATARSLCRQESNTIGVVIPEMGNTFFAEVLKGIGDAIEKKGMTMILCDTDNNSERQYRALNMIKEQRVKGLILTPANDYSEDAENRKLKKQLKELDVPVVLLDRQVENSVWDGIYFENYMSAYSATEQLIKAGNRRIGVITGDLKLKIGRDRYQGYLQAMEDNNLKVEDKYVMQGDFTIERAYELMKSCIENGDIPDAVLTCNNRTSLGFMKALAEKKLELGRDIAAIGIDRIEVLEILDVPFSYVVRESVEMGIKAVEKLLERIENPDKQREIYVMPFEIVLKGSEKKQK